MGAGRYSGDLTGDPAGVPCDPEQWSSDSQRSQGFWFRRPYQDKVYQCWRCDRPDVFTAVDQKHTFEVRKAPIDQQRVLCRECHLLRCRLERVAGECRRRWAAERPALRRDRAFLLRWRAAVFALPEYGHRKDTAALAMLRKLAVAAPDPAVGPNADALGWRTETVVALAAGIRAGRAFDRLPVLADALEEAGCDTAELLADCRDPHIPPTFSRWVIDLLLRKV